MKSVGKLPRNSKGDAVVKYKATIEFEFDVSSEEEFERHRASLQRLCEDLWLDCPTPSLRLRRQRPRSRPRARAPSRMDARYVLAPTVLYDAE